MERHHTTAPHELHKDVSQAAAGLDNYMKSLQSQSELLRAQQGTEHELKAIEDKLDTLRRQRHDLIRMTEKQEEATLQKFSDAKHHAKEVMDQAKQGVPDAKPGLMDRISEAFTGQAPAHEHDKH